MTRLSWLGLILTSLPMFACSGTSQDEKALGTDGKNIIKGGYTVRFERDPTDALMSVDLLAERFGTLCKHPGSNSTTGLNKVWIYSFRDSKQTSAGGEQLGYAVLERGGVLMVTGWSTLAKPLNKKALWTLIQDVKQRFGCQLPIENPFPPPP